MSSIGDGSAATIARLRDRVRELEARVAELEAEKDAERRRPRGGPLAY